MIDFINNGCLFYGNAQTLIDSFNCLARACAFYRAGYGKDATQLQGYIPEEILYDLTRNSFSGNRFCNVDWFPIEASKHASNFELHEEIKIYNYSTHVVQNSLDVCSLVVAKGNYCENDRLQVLDGYHIATDARYDGTILPVQFRVKSIMHHVEHDELFVESFGKLSRPLDDDRFCVLPSFRAGGMCGANGENPMLLAYPYES